MYLSQPGNPRQLRSLRRVASGFLARFGQTMVISCGLALIALLATAGLAAASDPVDTVSDVPLTSSEAPESSEPSLTVEVTESSEPSLTVEVTESSEPSLTVEVTESSEPSLTVDLAPPQAPVLGGLPVEPVSPPPTLLAPLTELVADQPLAGTLPDADELVALPPLDRLAVPSTDAVSRELLDAAEDVRDGVTPLLWPAVQVLREPSEDAERPIGAERSPSSSRSVAVDGRGTYAADGQPAQPDTASGTVVDSTGIIRPPAAGCGWYRGEALSSVVVPRVGAGPGGSECGNSITDLNPFAAVLAALAAGGASAWILALRMLPNPTGFWLAAPVPPG